MPWAIALALVLGVAVAYWNVGSCGFVLLDDEVLVTRNPLVRLGLTTEGIEYAFSQSTASTYPIPLTLISLMADVSLFGVDSRAMHIENAAWHAANVLLVFALLRTLTGSLWRSALASALFGLHPLRVESVAWVTERKDVLALFFGLLGVLAYVRYVRRNESASYVIFLFCFLLSILAKPLMATLPVLLVLLDVWPLRRTRVQLGTPAASQPAVSIWKLAAEKVLPVAIVAAPMFLPVVRPERFHSIGPAAARSLKPAPEQTFPEAKPSIGVMIADVPVATVRYLWMQVWPVNLAVIYPRPEGGIRVVPVIGSTLLLLGVTVVAIRFARRSPWILFGWLWFIIALVPNFRVLDQEYVVADRYTYLPAIGLLIALYGALPETRTVRRVAIASSLAVLPILLALTMMQVEVWRSSITLFEHALKATEPSSIAHFNLGVAYGNKGQTELALSHFRQSLGLKPRDPEAHMMMAKLLMRNSGKLRDAINHCDAAIELFPSCADAYLVRGIIKCAIGPFDAGLDDYRQAVKFAPELPEAHRRLGLAIWETDREGGLAEFRNAIKLDPGFAEAHRNLRNAMQVLGRSAESD